tara:strand:+ start:1819 stop:1929 length:111 start_codon:yes stop_codon:yes gene_type:complete
MKDRPQLSLFSIVAEQLDEKKGSSPSNKIEIERGMS